jgi:dinuclear metal center YbgI/SA1388 family protein
MKLESILEYLDGYLGVTAHPDYPNALNGLQVEGPREVTHLCTAVDASEAAITEAVRRNAHLLMVHHGLFWDGLRPLTGRRHRKVAHLIRGELGVYSIHLPLDAHAEIGNCILLTRALGISPVGRFGAYKGAELGWWGELNLERKQLVERAQVVLDGPVELLAYGPERTERVGVVTGSGGSLVEEAARLNLDTLVTGEGSHHVAIDAAELGINIVYGGHYATETFGIRALGEHLAERFGLEQEFLNLPTGT